jgi:hypothetical protein
MSQLKSPASCAEGRALINGATNAKKPLTGAFIQGRRPEHVLLVHFNIVLRKAEVRADLVDDDAVDQARDVFVRFGPGIQDRPAVQVNRVLLLRVLGDGTGALVAAEQIERRFQLQLLLDKGVGKILDDDLQLAGVFLQPFGQLIDDGRGNLLDVFERGRDRESHKNRLGFQVNDPDMDVRETDKLNSETYNTESEGICPWLK